MPKHMRVNSLSNPCLLGIAMKALPCPLRQELTRLLPLCDKQGRMVIMALEVSRFAYFPLALVSPLRYTMSVRLTL